MLLKSIKIKRSWLKYNPIDLLKAVGAVKGNQAYPYYVYVSPSFYKVLKSNTTKQYLKEFSYLTPRSKTLKTSVGMYFLNYGPVETPGVAENYVLVDACRIEQDEESKVTKQYKGDSL